MRCWLNLTRMVKAEAVETKQARKVIITQVLLSTVSRIQGAAHTLLTKAIPTG